MTAQPEVQPVRRVPAPRPGRETLLEVREQMSFLDVIAKQVLRSGTAIGALVREAATRALESCIRPVRRFR